ncbi:MAG: NAD(P)/FAD-dependent oxidoreductase [Chitinophagaceae bacterium]
MAIQLSYWDNFLIEKPYDYIIIGGGLMGLWSAYELVQKKPGAQIAIVEKHPFPHGASTRNAGFACFGSITELLYDIGLNGEDKAISLAEQRWKGIQKIRSTFQKHTIDFTLCGGYDCIQFTKTAHSYLADGIITVNKLLNSITKTDNTFQLQKELVTEKGLKYFDCLVENSFEGSLHSGKLVYKLQQLLAAKGVAFLHNTNAIGFELVNNYMQVFTNWGSMQCQQLIVAANAWIPQLLPQYQEIEPGRGQLIMTEPISNLATTGTFHFDEGFYYWRNVGNAILLGGGRNHYKLQETTTETIVTENLKEHLTYFIKEYFNLKKTPAIQHHWSGIMAFTENKQPIIEKIHAQLFVAFACNGMGVALTPTLAEKLSQIVLNK